MFKKILLVAILATSLTPFCGAMGCGEWAPNIRMPDIRTLQEMFIHEGLSDLMNKTHMLDQLTNKKLWSCGELKDVKQSNLMEYVAVVGRSAIDAMVSISYKVDQVFSRICFLSDATGSIPDGNFYSCGFEKKKGRRSY